jgi:PKD repeat protein
MHWDRSGFAPSGWVGILGVGLLAVAGCGETQTGVGNPADMTPVGAAGGTVTSADGRVTLVIPPGALDSTVGITVTPYQPQPGDPPMVPGTAYDLGPTGTEFLQPAQLTIAYDPAQVPAGADEAELHVFKLHLDGTQDFAPGAADVGARTVTGEIRSFSVRAVAPCPQCSLLFLDAEYNPDRTVGLTWLWAVEVPAGEVVRVERAEVRGRLYMLESDFSPYANLLPSNAFTDYGIGLEAAFYYYRVRWASASGSYLGPPSNVERITVFGTEGAPVARFTYAPAAPGIGDTVTFDASSSADDGSILFYDWDFSDNGDFDAEGQVVRFAYNAPGARTVRLRVTDDLSVTNETTRLITVGQGQYRLTVVVVGNGEVFSRDGDEATGRPPSLFCLGDNDPNTPPVECQADFARNTTVTLTPISFNPLPPGMPQASWQGCFRITANFDCEVFMDGDKTVTATIQ